MRGWSIPLGRWLGVELRVHAFFLLLAVVCVGLSVSDGGSYTVQRGLALFVALAVVVAVRETVRLLVAAWLGLRLRAIAREEVKHGPAVPGPGRGPHPGPPAPASAPRT